MEQEEQARLEQERIEKEKKEKEEKERLEREKLEKELKEKEEREKARKQKEERDKTLKEQKEQKERERKLKEEKIKKEKEEKERKEKEEQEKILKEKEEQLKKEKEKKEKKLKEKEEKEKKKKEIEERKKRENEKKELEKMLKLEEMKNNENEKKEKEKDKEREFIISYINSLDKKKKEFTPMLYRHPEKMYLKAINDNETNRERLKKLSQRNGQFDLILNRTKTNRCYINAENKEERLPTTGNICTNNNNQLRISFNNNENNESKTNFNKNKLLLKIKRGKSTGNSHLNSYKSPTKTINNYSKVSTNPNRKYLPKNIEKRNNSHTTKKENSEEKREITLNEMVQFLLENENEVTNLKRPIISNPINHRKATKQKNKIINSLNDPFNPYSVKFYNNMLYNNFNVGIHYKNIKQGVPNLRIKKMKRNDLPLIFAGNHLDDKIMSNTYSSNFNTSNKKKNVVLPMTAGNAESSKRKLYTERENEGNPKSKNIENKE